MRREPLFLATAALLAAIALPAMAATVTLESAGDFAVLGGSSVTNTGSSVINGGDVGLDPGTSISGFGSVTGTFTTHVNDSAAQTAQSDLTAAYVTAAGLAYTTDLTGTDRGNLTLTAGVYRFSTSAQLTGTLTLDYQGNSAAEFIFQIGSTLTTASNASVVAINGTGTTNGCGVYWQVGSSATLGTGTSFAGHILALSDITLNSGTSLFGSALARNGAVAFDSSTITNFNCATGGGGGGGSPNAVPLPTSALLGLALLSVAAVAAQRRLGRRRSFEVA